MTSFWRTSRSTTTRCTPRYHGVQRPCARWPTTYATSIASLARRATGGQPGHTPLHSCQITARTSIHRQGVGRTAATWRTTSRCVSSGAFTSRSDARRIISWFSAFNPYVPELERSGEATIHLESRAIGDDWQCRFFGLFFLCLLRGRLRGLYTLDLARAPKNRHKHQ